MSIFAGFGAVPENLTVPLTLAAVAGSIGAAVGPAGGGADGCCSALSFLPHPARRTIPSKTDRLQIAKVCFFFILFPASPLKHHKMFESKVLFGSALR